MRAPRRLPKCNVQSSAISDITCMCSRYYCLSRVLGWRLDSCISLRGYSQAASTTLRKLVELNSMLVMDNKVSFWNSEWVENIRSDAGVKLVYLPPYSKEFNRKNRPKNQPWKVRKGSNVFRSMVSGKLPRTAVLRHANPRPFCEPNNSIPNPALQVNYGCHEIIRQSCYWPLSPR